MGLGPEEAAWSVLTEEGEGRFVQVRQSGAGSALPSSSPPLEPAENIGKASSFAASVRSSFWKKRCAPGNRWTCLSPGRSCVTKRLPTISMLPSDGHAPLEIPAQIRVRYVPRDVALRRGEKR